MNTYEDYFQQKRSTEQKSLSITFIIHLLLLLLCFYPFMNYLYPPRLKGGIAIVFGNASEVIDAAKAGGDNHTNNSSTSNSTPAELTNSTPTPIESPLKSGEGKKEKSNNAARKNAKNDNSNTTSENTSEKITNRFSDLFGEPSNTPQPSKGDPQSNQDINELEKLSKTSDKVGGGLKGRGVIFEPKILDYSQKTGRVVIEVCVDRFGNVISSRFTQRGSTTADDYLIKLAEQNALKYKFASGETNKQCGTITMDFKVQ